MILRKGPATGSNCAEAGTPRQSAQLLTLAPSAAVVLWNVEAER